MVGSPAKTVSEYLASLPEERRKVIAGVRRVIKANLPPGYRETMNWSMICYEIPLKRYPDTYNGQPLCYAGLAAHKNHYAVYLTGIYTDPKLAARFRDQFKAEGKRLDMGKSCVKFRALADLSLPAIGKVIASTAVDAYISRYESTRKKT